MARSDIGILMLLLPGLAAIAVLGCLGVYLTLSPEGGGILDRLQVTAYAGCLPVAVFSMMALAIWIEADRCSTRGMTQSRLFLMTTAVAALPVSALGYALSGANGVEYRNVTAMTALFAYVALREPASRWPPLG